MMQVSVGKSLAVYCITAFLANFFWESWHAFLLYDGIVQLTVPRYVLLITYASSVDMVMLAAILAGGMAWWRGVAWWQVMGRGKYTYIVGAAFILAVWVEFRAVYLLDRWVYNEHMPALFGIGLVPLLQLPLTGLLALWMARK